MISEQLVRGVQALLGRFGIFARVAARPSVAPTGTTCGESGSRNAGDRRAFADEIGFLDPVKAAKLEQSLRPAWPCCAAGQAAADRRDRGAW